MLEHFSKKQNYCSMLVYVRITNRNLPTFSYNL